MKPDMRWFFFGISGRISRLPYLLGMLFVLVVGMAILNELIVSAPESDQPGFWQVIIWIYAIVSQWMIVVLSVKRLHDFNKPGLIAIVVFVPVLVVLAIILLCIVPGTPGPNAYGNRTDRPKSQTIAALQPRLRPVRLSTVLIDVYRRCLWRRFSVSSGASAPEHLC